MPSSLKWFASNVKATYSKEAQVGLVRIGMLTRRQARRNITENDQIDTRFMWNSVYVATPDTRTTIAPDGSYLARRSGKQEWREAGPIVQPAEGVFVGAAAGYAVYQELENSFLYRAIEQVEGREAEAALEGVSRGLYAGFDE